MPVSDSARPGGGAAVGVRRIVVADDNHEIADILTLSLELHGYEVRAAYDGQEALETVTASLPDLAVLDIMMPRMHGLEVVALLKADPRTAHIPVVMLSAKASDSDVWNGWQAGADYYITKPFEVDELLRYITYLEDTAEDPV